MKIFHLFANHKFTGPADLAMVMASSQQAAGAEVRFFSSTHPDAENSVEQIARANPAVRKNNARSSLLQKL